MKTRRIRIPFLAAAAVSVTYYVALFFVDPVSIVYFKPGWIFNFSLVWLAIAFAFLIPAFPESRAARACSRTLWGSHKRKIATISGTIFAGVFAAVSLALAIWIMVPIGDGSLVPEIGQEPASATIDDGAKTYIVVLGGGIRLDGSVSVALKSRLDAAITYRAWHPETRLVVTGGKLRDLPRSEGEAMSEYLVAHAEPAGSIATESILAEDQAKDTIQNMANIRTLIAADTKSSAATAGIPGGRPTVIILTNDFHLKRSLYLARLAGYENPRGIAAPCPPILLPHSLLREVGAWWKLGIRQAALALQGKKLLAR